MEDEEDATPYNNFRFEHITRVKEPHPLSLRHSTVPTPDFCRLVTFWRALEELLALYY